MYEATSRPEARKSLYQGASPSNLTGRIVNLADQYVILLEGGNTALVDLSTDDQGHGQILGSIDPAEAKVNVSHYFLL